MERRARRLVGPFARGDERRSDDGIVERGEVDDGEELVDVDVLGGQSTAHHVVAAGHDLDAGAEQVGVDVAGVEEDRLAGLQDQVVEQQGHERAPVAGVARRDPLGPRRSSVGQAVGTVGQRPADVGGGAVA